MSKKKTKTRFAKVGTKHDFSHLEKTVISAKTGATTTDSANPVKAITSLHDAFIGKDLRMTGIVLGAFVGFIAIAGILTHYTGLFRPLLKLVGITY